MRRKRLQTSWSDLEQSLPARLRLPGHQQLEAETQVQMDQLVGFERSVKPGGFTFEEMHLKVGSRLQLQINAGANSAQHFTTLIGFVKDEYLIVRVPFENGLSIALQQEATVVIRVLSGVHVFAFSCVVLRIFLSPIFYAHLSFPDKIPERSFGRLCGYRGGPRRNQRADAAPVTARFTNLSATGGFIESATEIGQRDQTLRFAFSIRVQPGNREVKIEPPLYSQCPVRCR